MIFKCSSSGRGGGGNKREFLFFFLNFFVLLLIDIDRKLDVSMEFLLLKGVIDF